MEFGLRTTTQEAARNGEAAVLTELFKAFQSDSMSIQRPSAAVKSYAVVRAEILPIGWSQTYGDNEVKGPLFKAHLEFELDTDVISAVLKSWGSDQREFVTHRSRVAAISVRRLCYTENSVRLARVQQRGDWKPDPSISAVAKRAWLDFELTMLKSLKIGEHTARYIREHSSSHVAPGVLWPDLTDDAIERLLQSCKDHLTLRIEKGLDCMEILHPFDIHYGQRARSPKLECATVGSTYDIEMGRTRIVMYRGGMSGVNAFVPEGIEIKAYRRAIEKVASAAGYTGCVHSPVISGGEFYIKMSELMSTHTYAATDGANWEINVPTIIPNILAYTYVGGQHFVLPSGSHDTSLLGSLASLVFAADLKGVEAISVQGDDLGLFYKNRVLYRDVPGISELDPMDSKLKYVLGYSFLDPDKPHSIGIKLTTDSAEYMDNRNISNPGPPKSRKLTPDAIARWIAVYTGELEDGTTLLEELKKLPAGSEMYPRKTMEMIQNGSSDEEALQAYAA